MNDGGREKIDLSLAVDIYILSPQLPETTLIESIAGLPT